MAEVQCVKIPFKKGQTGQFLVWVEGLKNRRGEVLEAMRAEGIMSEAVFLESSEDADYMLLYTRANDLKAANQAFQESEIAVDTEFKALMAATLDLQNAKVFDLVFEASVGC